MRILFITSSSINGGAQKHIRDMVRCLSKIGYEVHLVAPMGWLLEELLEYSERIHVLPASIKNVRRLQVLIEAIKPDITNTFILSGGLFGCVAWRKKKYGKLFITVNNPVLYEGIPRVRRFLYPKIYRWLSCYATAFLVKSNVVRDEVELVIRNRKPVISIKNGIDLKIFDRNAHYEDIRTAFGITPKDIVLTNVAALDKRKGQNYLIEAVCRLSEKYPIQLFLVGEGIDETKLKKQVADEGAGGYIHFLGRRNDINTILANSDIFVLPSLHEGLPNALMEAMAMGLPCIAADVGGVRQLIEKETEGYVVTPRSVEQMICVICNILHNPTQANQMGELAYKKIESQYRLEGVARQLIQIYLNN